MIRVEVVTPVHDRRDETLQCLRSIHRSNLPSIDLHIIVVDDGSTDGTADAIRSDYPETEIVKGDGTLWYTAGTNRGLSAALKHDPEYILAINNDQIFDENCILEMVSCAEKHPRSVIGSLLLNWDTPHRLFQVSPRFELLSGGFRHWYKQTIWTIPEKPWEVEIIVGNCVLYPATAVREVGLMDEESLVQYGDAEYTPRMRRSGWKLLIEPKARVFCKPNDLVSGFRKLTARAKLDQLLFKPTGPYSLRRRLNMNLGGAPTRLQGFLAVPIFFLRLALGRNVEGGWALEQEEKPLSETFSKSVVND